MHYKDLLKIILQSAVLLPVDNDYYTWMIVYMIDYTHCYHRKEGSGHPTPLLVLIFLHNRAVFPNKSRLITKHTQRSTNPRQSPSYFCSDLWTHAKYLVANM